MTYLITAWHKRCFILLYMRAKKRARTDGLGRDIFIGIVLGVLAFSLSRHARASEVDTYVNGKIKEEFIRMDADRLRASFEYAREKEILEAYPQDTIPLNYRNRFFDNITNQTDGDGPTADLTRPPDYENKKLDPLDPIERMISEKQAYDLYREHYRGAVQKEFVRRLKRDGYTTSRNIAEEIKTLEDAQHQRASTIPR